MLSSLNIITIFIEILTTGILISGTYGFLRLALKSKKLKDSLLTAIFGSYTLVVAGTLLSQLLFNFGLPVLTLIKIQKMVALCMILASGLLFVFFIRPQEKLKKWFTFLPIGLITFTGILMVLFSEVTLGYRSSTIEPLINFSHPFPFRIFWSLAWIGIAVTSLLRYRQKKERLALFAMISSGLFILSQIFLFSYIQAGSSLFLFSSWLTALLGTIGFFLANIIPPESEISQKPLNFFRTRILYKLITILGLLLILLFEGTTMAIINISKASLSQAILNAHTRRAHEVASQASTLMENIFINFRQSAQSGYFTKDKNSAQIALNLLVKNNPMLEKIFYTNLEGEIVAVNSSAQQDLSDLKELIERDTFQEIFKEGLYLSSMKGITEFYIMVATPTTFPNGGYSGILGGKVNLKKIQDLVASQEDRSKTIYFVNQNGHLFAHPDQKRAFEKEDLSELIPVQTIMQGGSGQGEFFDEYGEQMVGAYVSLPNLNWGVVIEQPLKDAYSELRRVETLSLIFIILGIMASSAVGIIFALGIERPLDAVVKGTEAIRTGNLDYKIEIKNIDEVGKLGAAFNRMTKELKDTQNSLIRSEKLAALGTLAAGMAHEIKNPLVSIKTFTQLLSQKFDDVTFREKFSSIIPQEIDRIDKITENLLKFGRPSKPEFEAVDLNQVMDEVLSLTETQAKKSNVVVAKEYGEIPSIDGDRGQLSQAFLNLILNAIQAMGAPSAAESPKGGELKIHSFMENNQIMIEISDTGSGIDEKELEAIFDIFYTTRPAGTGMGLPITVKIIEAHGGSIKATSKKGEGSTFKVILPTQ